MSKMYNPYHFVPLPEEGKRSTAGDLPWETAVGDSDAGIGHGRHRAGRHSGRLIVRLHTASPTFVGSGTRDSDPDWNPETGFAKSVQPYRVEGIPASIPASSLKGMLSSVAEVISDSAPRVLEDRKYSYRPPLDQALSATGRMIRDGSNGWKLQPLTLPTLAYDGSSLPGSDDWTGTRRFLNAAEAHSSRHGGGEDPATIPFRLPPDLEQVWPLVFPVAPAFRVLLNRVAPRDLTRISKSGRAWMQVSRVRWSPPGSRSLIGLVPRAKPGGSRLFVLGDDHGGPRPSENPTVGSAEVEGFLRGLRGDLPRTVKHAHFLPDLEGNPPLDVPSEVTDSFEELAQEASDLRGVSGGSLATPHFREESDGKPWRLRNGDLVVFDVVLRHGKPVVSRIAFSSSWRSWMGYSSDGEVPEPITSHGLFARPSQPGTTDQGAPTRPNSVPFHAGRQELTLAERVFGVVETESPLAERPKGQAGRALAGRITPGDARGLSGEEEDYLCGDAYVLKALQSPKPPSPALYLRPSPSGNSVGGKAQLDKLGRGSAPDPQGSKQYLHHPSTLSKTPPEKGQAPFESKIFQRLVQSREPKERDRTQLHVQVRPLAPDRDLFFHLDFEDLTDLEFGLLLRSIEPSSEVKSLGTSPNFLHKLGMGRSLGLGSVRLTLAAAYFIDRLDRYALGNAETPLPGLLSPRNTCAWHSSNDSSENWRDDKRYRQEFQAEAAHSEISDRALERLGQALEAFDAAFPSSARPRKALLRLGNPANVRQGIPVGTPLLPHVDPQGPDAEDETFKWFMQREIQNGFFTLTPLDQSKDDELPMVPRDLKGHRGGPRGPGGSGGNPHRSTPSQGRYAQSRRDQRGGRGGRR